MEKPKKGIAAMFSKSKDKNDKKETCEKPKKAPAKKSTKKSILAMDSDW